MLFIGAGLGKGISFGREAGIAPSLGGFLPWPAYLVRFLPCVLAACPSALSNLPRLTSLPPVRPCRFVRNWAIGASVTAVQTSGHEGTATSGQPMHPGEAIRIEENAIDEAPNSSDHRPRRVLGRGPCRSHIASEQSGCLGSPVRLPGKSGAADPSVSGALLAPRSARRSAERLPREATSDPRLCPESRYAPQPPTEGTATAQAARTSRVRQ